MFLSGLVCRCGLGEQHLCWLPWRAIVSGHWLHFFWGSGVLVVYIFETLIEKILIQNSSLSLHSHFIFVFLMLSTITVFHFLGPIWCLSICSWTGNIGAYKWVMYCDLPLEQHYLIKERASLHCFVSFYLYVRNYNFFISSVYLFVRNHFIIF